jgi:hypothetical protein
VKKTAIALTLVAAVVLTGCKSAADTANDNLNKAADNFEVPRRITAINGITDQVLFTVEGFCSVSTPGGDFFVTCKLPNGDIQRTSMILSDNVTAVVSQIGGKHVDLFRPRVIFRPETIIPNFDLSTSAG